ncbi:hypothetical protein RDT67_20155 [Serratia fonticola]|uniref:Uncharacterized protein n=1 Tax=Serratia fonticola TaxID=47917 RepID=A0AAJ1YIB9_SERFO|nr:hypothetical protein [Serratia fonticola]MDQ9128735.1 hypothetical protein [Serratia fonticola]
MLHLSTNASAVVYGGTNLGFSGYPEFSEIEPVPPYSKDQWAWDSYKRDVEDYVQKAKDYTDDANSDISRINEAKEETIRKANDVVEEYNRNARGY